MSGKILYLATAQQNDSPLWNMGDYRNTLFGKCSKGFIEIRQMNKESKVCGQQWLSLNGELPSFPNDQHAYVGVATRIQEGSKKEDIEEIPAVWVDVDFKDIKKDEIDKRISSFTLKPSMIVESGNGYHLYWILNQPATKADIEKIEDVNKRLAEHFNGDKAATEAARILRLPETYNIKYDPPREVIIKEINSNTYNIDDFSFLPPVEPPNPIQPASLAKAEEWYERILQGVHEGERHTSAFRLASRYNSFGMSESEAQIFLAQWNEKNMPPLTNDELTKTITDNFKRYKKDVGKNEINDSQNFVADIESSITTFNKFIGKSLPVKPDIIKPLLKRGEIIMVSAVRGIGKTWFALSLGFMATRQASIGNWETSTPTATLYVDGEMSEDEMQDRISKLKMGRTKEEVPFYLLSSDEMRSSNKKAPNLTIPKWRESISSYLNKHPDIGLVIFDNMSSLTPGRDENKKKEFDDINEWFLNLRSKGIAVIFLHHAGKGGDQRGTSAIEDNINFSIRLKRPEGYKNDDGAKFVVEFTKTRRLYGENAKSFTLHLQSDGGALDWKVINEEIGAKEKEIADLLGQGLKQKEIAEQVGVSTPYVSQIKKKLKKEEEERKRRMDLLLQTDEDKDESIHNPEEVEIVEAVEE